MNTDGTPSSSSNWGKTYLKNGILAPGKNILGAIPGGRTDLMSGSSFATPIVSGVAALLLSVQLKHGNNLDPHAVRSAILNSAIPCDPGEGLDCRRYLAGTLNVSEAYRLVIGGEKEGKFFNEVTWASETNVVKVKNLSRSSKEAKMNEPDSNTIINLEQTEVTSPPAQTGVSTELTKVIGMPVVETRQVPAYSHNITPSLIMPSTECSCGSGGPVTLVYALGKLGTDFGTQARRDTFIQFMAGSGSNPDDPKQLLSYFNEAPYEAKSLIWTLNIDANPVYAISPSGPFAERVYDRLREFLDDQVNGISEIVSIPGYIFGSVTLYSGQTVPIIVPEVRGLFNWAVTPLIEKVLGKRPAEIQPGADQPSADQPQGPSAWDNRERMVTAFLNRVYFDLRNLGLSGPDRALNYSATNLFQLLAAIDNAVTSGRQEFRSFSVLKSPICRPESECYDVKVRFFDPDNVLRSSFVVFFTIDVSDVIPVAIGGARQWFEG